ncbi:MAG: hypothetical protein ACOX1P_05970 [Thermoguttaceae bacterium]|jgi:hypothetical protein
MFHRLRRLCPVIAAVLVGAYAIVGSLPAARAAGEASRDPTFDSVSRLCPALRYPREAIGVKEHRDDFVIMPDGSLNFAASAFFTLGKTGARLGRTGSGMLVKKRLLDGYMPIVIAEYEHDPSCKPGMKFEQVDYSGKVQTYSYDGLGGDRHLRFEQTAVAWSEGMSADEPIWAFVRMKVSNTSDSKREVNLSWNVDYGVEKEQRVRKVASWQFELAPGAEQAVYGKLPYRDGYNKAVKSTAEQFEERLAEASACWKQLLNKGMRIEVPEERVNNAYRAWLAYVFLNVDKIGDRYEPHDGSGFYEEIYGIMAAKCCIGLDLMGFGDEARKYLDSLATLISPQGEFNVRFGSIDTGMLLLAMANHYRLSGDESWLRKAAPNMIKMCDWIIKTRKSNKARQDADSPCYGLILSNLGADHPEPYYSYVTDAGLCVGMEAAAKALRELGMSDDAARIARESAAYRQDIEKSMDRAVIERDGMKILPIIPETHKYLKQSGYTARGYYSLFASIFLETKFLPAADKRFRLLSEFLEKRDGLEMGMCTFGAKGGIDHAFTYGYWMNCLERDEVARVLLGFYGTMAYGMSRGTWAGVECTNMLTGAHTRTTPHLRSSIQQLRLLRNMLVREQGDALILAQAIPQHWLEHGKQVRVEGAPTWFGKVSYTIDSLVNDGRIRVRIAPPAGEEAPDAIKLYLRHPSNVEIRTVTVDGVPVKEFAAGNMTLKGLKGPTVVEVGYR